MKEFKKWSLAVLAAGLFSIGAAAPAGATLPAALPSPVSHLDLSRYQGVWYEIAHFHETSDYLGSRNAFAHYFPVAGATNQLQVVDQRQRIGGLASQRRWTTLAMPDASRPGELVKHGQTLLRSSYVKPYHVYAIDDAYTTAVVGEPTGRHLVLLSRTPYMERSTLSTLLGWLGSHAMYADILDRLRCNNQSRHLNDGCKAVLSELREAR